MDFHWGIAFFLSGKKVTPVESRGNRTAVIIMKHIDCAQNWVPVRILRDKTICIPARVNTDDDLADMFTKILSVDRFRTLRSLLMFERPH